MEDSSVLFNLNEIMRLERDRVAAEEAAVRAAEAHAVAQREARLREEREQAARQQAAREHAAAERTRLALEATRAEEAERAAALLRVRLEAEAEQRIADRQLELARAERMNELAEEHRKKRASWAMAAALVGLCVASGASYAYVLEPALRAARDRSAALDQLTADAAAQTAALARQIEELRAQRQQASAALPAPADLTPSQASSATPTRHRPRSTQQTITKPSTKPADTSLDGLDADDDDPIGDLFEPAPKRRRSR